MIGSKLAWDVIRSFVRTSPVRQEQSGTRDLDMSRWLRQHCRPSKGGCTLDGIELGCFVASDLDFILYDYKRQIVQLLEVKTRNGQVRFAQKQILDLIDRALAAAAPIIGFQYLGLHVLRMDGTDPINSKSIEWDGAQVTPTQCWRKVNMIDSLEVAA